ncbi:ABC transporter permease, partial [Enterococcus cecorum]
MARTVWWIGSILALVGLFFIHWLIFYLMVLLVNLHFFSQQKRLKTSLIDWTYTIDSEQKRMYRIYRFINLFTDVPFIESKMRKMRGAQWLFDRVAKKQTKTYSYLFVRRFMRSDEYFGQIVRLLLLGGACLLAVDDWRFSLVVSGLFLYLITFQMIPMMTQYQSQVLTRLYPVAKEIKEKNFYAILRWVLSMSALIFILVSLVTIQLHLVPFVILGNIVIVVILQGAYVPMRLKKIKY